MSGIVRIHARAREHRMRNHVVFVLLLLVAPCAHAQPYVGGIGDVWSGNAADAATKTGCSTRCPSCWRNRRISPGPRTGKSRAGASVQAELLRQGFGVGAAGFLRQ